MSRSSGQRNKGSETLIILTTSRDDIEASAPEYDRVSRPQSAPSRKSVYKILQRAQSPLPRAQSPLPRQAPPPPQQTEDVTEISASISHSLEGPGADDAIEGSTTVRLIPRGSVVFEQVSEIGRRRSSSSSRKYSPPRRKSVPAALPSKRQERSRSLSKASHSSRAVTPTIIHVVQEDVMESKAEFEEEREPEEDDDTEIKIRFEFKTASSSQSSSSSAPDAVPAQPPPEPCLDCLEEFVRRKRAAEKQREKPKKSSSGLKVTMSKRMCSSRRSPSASSRPPSSPSNRRSSSNGPPGKGPTSRCPKCYTCKSCGSINVTVP